MRAKAIIAVSIVALITVRSISVSAQSLTIREIAAASDQKTVTMTVREDDRVVPIAELSAASDLVVDARLVRPRSYLSDDKTTIYTDYEIVPSRVLRSRTTDVGQTPGPRPALVLTIHGGELSLDGKTIKLTSATLKPITSGARFLVFVSRSNRGANRFEATGGSGGIFEVLEGGRVDPLLRSMDPNPEVQGVAFEDIVRKIQSVPRR